MKTVLVKSHLSLVDSWNRLPASPSLRPLSPGAATPSPLAVQVLIVCNKPPADAPGSPFKQAPQALQFAKGQTYSDANSNSYTFAVLSEEGCERHQGAFHALGSMIGVSVDDGDTPWGTEFIVLFLLTLSLYVCVGMFYNYRVKGVSGFEACPHVDFWQELPSLVKDGVAYSRSLLGGCLNRFDSQNRDGCFGYWNSDGYQPAASGSKAPGRPAADSV